MTTLYLNTASVTVNGLNAWTLGSSRNPSLSSFGAGAASWYDPTTFRFTMDVAKRSSGGTMTVLGSGLCQHDRQRYFYDGGSEVFTGTWACPATTIGSTDSLVLTHRVKCLDDSIEQVVDFTTQQNPGSLSSSTWSLHRSEQVIGANDDNTANGSIVVGGATWDTYIENVTLTPNTTTLYWRYDTATVNGLSANKLGTTKLTDTYAAFYGEPESPETRVQTAHSMIVRRGSGGTETVLGGWGSAASTNSIDEPPYYGGSALRSANWLCPSVALSATDSLVVYEAISFNGFQSTNVVPFSTAQNPNGAEAGLSSSTWTLFRYFAAEDVWGDGSQYRYVRMYGNQTGSQAQTRIEGILFGAVTGGSAQQYPVSGTAAASSGLSGSVTARLGASGSSAVSTTLSGSVRSLLRASGTVPSVSIATGSITARYVVSGMAAAVSALSGDIAARMAASGVSASESGLIGDITALLVAGGFSDAQSQTSLNATIYDPNAAVSLPFALDGYLRTDNADFLTAVNASVASAANSAASLYALCRFSTPNWSVYRTYITVDLSSIGFDFGAGTKLSLTRTGLQFAGNQMCLVAGTHGSTLTTADFPSHGTTELSDRVNVPADAYGVAEFVLNQAGLDYINAAGPAAKFCIMSDADFDKVAPAQSTTITYFGATENATPSYRPFMYAVPAIAGESYPVSGLAEAVSGLSGSIAAKLLVRESFQQLGVVPFGEVTARVVVSGATPLQSSLMGDIAARMQAQGRVASVTTAFGNTMLDFSVSGMSGSVSTSSGSIAALIDVSGIDDSSTIPFGSVSNMAVASGMSRASSGVFGRAFHLSWGSKSSGKGHWKKVEPSAGSFAKKVVASITWIRKS